MIIDFSLIAKSLIFVGDKVNRKQATQHCTYTEMNWKNIFSNNNKPQIF